MEANPEVMPQPGTVPKQKPAAAARETRESEAAARPSAIARPPGAPRISEDPMRRTDRYRLVMPWASRL